MRLALKTLALAAFGWAALVVLTGGLSIDAGGFTLRSHDPIRPAVAGLVCLACYALLSGWRQVVLEVRSFPRTIGRAAPFVALWLGCFVIVFGLRNGVFVAGGADSYGYVSQAELWQRGRLQQPQPLVSVLPWPDALSTLAPLGYIPSRDRTGIVPTYAPGLPILMALFRVALGPCGQYGVVPLLGGLMVWLAFVLGRRLTGRDSVGLGAALVLATSNPFAFSLLWPMSDVPVAAAWTLAPVLALPGTVLASLMAGLASSAAVLIRPNLVPLGLVIGVALLWRAVGERRVSTGVAGPLLAFACGLLPGIAVAALVNQHLYGSPFSSGYGSLGYLYALGNVGPNARHYTGWILESGSGYVFLGMLAILGPWPRTMAPAASRLSLRVLFGGFIVVTWLSYLFYAPFEAWWYLRFLLATWPVSIVFAAALALDLLKRLRMPAAGALIVVAAFGFFLDGRAGVSARGMLGLRRVENRYAAAGDLVRRTTEPGAIILAMQHSGSVRYYGGRQSVRYDLLDPACLDPGVQSLAGRSYHVLALLDDWEEPLFRKRFASRNRLGRLDWRPVAVISSGVRLYDLTQTESEPATDVGFLRNSPCSGVPTDAGTVPQK